MDARNGDVLAVAIDVYHGLAPLMRPKDDKPMAKLFFSYSHRDESLRDELENHLSQLKREGVIETWHDRRISAGSEFEGAISEHLESADVILLLVSSYFLASNYCNDVELKRAIERHHAGEACVIPVILRPCDWHTAPFGKLLAVPNDGRAITKFPDIHDGLLEVVKALRIAVPTPASKDRSPQLVAESQTIPQIRRTEIRSSNLQVRKSFTDHDRDAFQDDAFEYLSAFFEESLAELQRRNPGISTRFKRIDAQRFAAYIYHGGDSVGECSIRLGSMFGGGISYSHDANSTNSLNESLSVGDNGTSLFLRSSGLSSYGGEATKELTFQGAAELLWGLLMRPLQSRTR